MRKSEIKKNHINDRNRIRLSSLATDTKLFDFWKIRFPKKKGKKKIRKIIIPNNWYIASIKLIFDSFPEDEISDKWKIVSFQNHLEN